MIVFVRAAVFICYCMHILIAQLSVLRVLRHFDFYRVSVVCFFTACTTARQLKRYAKFPMHYYLKKEVGRTIMRKHLTYSLSRYHSLLTLFPSLRLLQRDKEMYVVAVYVTEERWTMPNKQ